MGPIGIREYCRTLAHNNVTNMPDSEALSKKTPEFPSNHDEDLASLERSVKLSLLRQNFVNRGLKSPRNRDSLVLDFFNLSKAAIENRLSVENLVKTDTFQQLELELDYNIDAMGNAQIINLLASAIKMQINPSTTFVKVLEHEVKFRLRNLNFTQIIKLLKFYNSSEMTSEQKQLADMLNHRVRAYIQNQSNIDELNAVLNLIAAQQASSSLLGLVEERLLNLFVDKEEDEEEDIVSEYLHKSSFSPRYSYQTICNLFVELAKNKRRPTPLLKAASTTLCNMNSSGEKLNQELIISTLNALVNMNYTDRALISRLINDLAEIIDLDELHTDTVCSLLRTLVKLRWRSVQILEKLSSHINENRDDLCKINHNLVLTFLYVASIVNFRISGGIQKFYSECMQGRREQMLDRNSRKWLTYVWSLTTLDLNDESLLRSVLSKDFYTAIYDSSTGFGNHYSDMMKLLNLRAIARHGLKLENLDCKHLDDLTANEIQRNIEIKKFASKVKEVLASDLSYEVHTPFGFTVDCEFQADENCQLQKLDEKDSLLHVESPVATHGRPLETNQTKCALIYVSYDDMIANFLGEVSGHKQMISKILKILDFKTIFLMQPVLDREKTSADFVNKINSTIKEALMKQTST